jgi:hypothetical protein
MLYLYIASSMIVSFTLISAVKYILKSRKLPPGPPGWPIIGNISDLPPPGGKDWEHWAKFKDVYGRVFRVPMRLQIHIELFEYLGPISSLTSMGQTIVILNNADVVHGVLGKQSTATASRPISTVLQHLYVSSSAVKIIFTQVEKIELAGIVR